MENYYTTLGMDEDSPYISIPHLVNIEFGSLDDTKFYKTLVNCCDDLYMNEYTRDYFVENNHACGCHSDATTFYSDGTLYLELDKHRVLIDEKLPDKWVIFEGQLPYAYKLIDAMTMNCSRKGNNMTKIKIIDNKNVKYTKPQNFKVGDCFYNEDKDIHCRLISVLNWEDDDNVALLDIEDDEVIATDVSAEDVITACFGDQGAKHLIKIPANQVEVTYKFYPDQD